MYTGNYECLELFVKPEAGKKGSVSLKKVKENKTEIKELRISMGTGSSSEPGAYGSMTLPRELHVKNENEG